MGGRCQIKTYRQYGGIERKGGSQGLAPTLSSEVPASSLTPWMIISLELVFAVGSVFFFFDRWLSMLGLGISVNRLHLGNTK